MGLRKKAAARRADADRPSSLRREGSVRRAQLITTYGVGAIMAIGEQSFIVSGLDSWKVGEKPDLTEFRLQNRLRVSGFRLPPGSGTVERTGDGVRIRRFPEMYSCPGIDAETGDGCRHNLRRYREFNPRRGANECAACGGALTPSRFVVACENGHLDDFPYLAWVHARKGSACRNGRLSLRTTGRTASLRSIEIHCSCGETASMEGVFARNALKRIGVRCRGGRPWLGFEGRQQGCQSLPRTLQRGSSAAWFSVVRSALSIPPFSETLHKQIQPYYELWRDVGDEVIVRQAKTLKLLDGPYKAADVTTAVAEYREYENRRRTDPSVITGFEAADVLRSEEYRHLCRDVVTEDFECESPLPDPSVQTIDGIGQTMQVTRLREVRVLETFTRVEPPTELDFADRSASLSLNEIDWLPGIEVVGEGVFLRLDEKRLTDWEREIQSKPKKRAARIRSHHELQLASRAGDREPPKSHVSARYVLLHTFAHVLINEWSLDAGYPASSLRERLYVAEDPGKDMAGVLIYTATSDSAGSLGGLIRQGEPRRLQASIASALRRSSWCSNDPLCMEADAAGADSLNLAACHACVLLPEVSCEGGNNFLDRGLLIGPDGFFGEQLDTVMSRGARWPQSESVGYVQAEVHAFRLLQPP